MLFALILAGRRRRRKWRSMSATWPIPVRPAPAVAASTSSTGPWRRSCEAALAARGIGVRPINYDGRIASLSARPDAARGADLSSLHHDSLPAHEQELWVWEGQRLSYSDKYAGFSLRLAAQSGGGREQPLRSAIGASMRLAGFVPTRHHYPEASVGGRGERRALARQPRRAAPDDAAGRALRAGVIKHRDEELLLADPERMARMADAIATGVAACLYAMPR